MSKNRHLPIGTKCKKCGTTGDEGNPLSRHHVLPRRWFGDEGEIITFCRHCHDRIELFIPQSKVERTFYIRILELFLKEVA